MVTATKPKSRISSLAEGVSAQHRNPLCPQCGGRLFLESEKWNGRLLLYLGCLNCSRQYDFSGNPIHPSR